MLVPSSTPKACILMLNTFPVKVTEGLVVQTMKCHGTVYVYLLFHFSPGTRTSGNETALTLP